LPRNNIGVSCYSWVIVYCQCWHLVYLVKGLVPGGYIHLH
jgi:hypothetical protein